MKALRRFFLWGLVFCGLLAAADQVLLKAPLTAPGLHEVQVFYRDFRGRMLTLFGVPGGGSIEQLIGEAERGVTPAAGAGPVAPGVTSGAPGRAPLAQRYLYVDQDGALQFAESLQQVPPRYRASAQLLKD